MLAYDLALTVKSVLLLEGGDYIPNEKKNWHVAVQGKGLYPTEQLWFNLQDKCQWESGATFVIPLKILSPVKNKTIVPKKLAINHFYFASPEDATPLGQVHLMGHNSSIKKWAVGHP